MLSSKKRLFILVGAVTAAVLVGAGVATALVFEGQSEAAPAPTPTAKASAEARLEKTPPDAEFARTALFHGQVDAWQFPGGAEIAAVMPETGSAQSGAVSLAVDAPAVRTAATAVMVDVAVEAGKTYT